MGRQHFCVPPWVAALVVVGLTCVAYANSFNGDFVMDDQSEIEENTAMGLLFPPWRAMFVGNLLPARPLPYLTFAIDYSIAGPHPFCYHVTNLVIHVTSAIALFGFTRLTFLSPRLKAVYGDRATILAAIIATVWAVHPLQTQSVTYVYQRIESLTGMFSLLSLLAFAQAAASHWSNRWLTYCIVSAAAAMASKENAVVLPFLIASYDWLFCNEGLTGFNRRRWWYAGLSATWVILAAVLASQSGRYSELQHAYHSPLAYALTQPRVIILYLRLATVPNPLCFDYIWRVADTWSEFLPSLVYVLVLIIVTARGFVCQRPYSWLGMSFLLTLAPTSSFMPVVSIAAEHRMYLPLAAFVAAVVLGCDHLLQRFASRQPSWRTNANIAAIVCLCLWVAGLIALTWARNDVYAAPGGIWRDVLSKQPTSTRALWNMARASARHGDMDGALQAGDAVAALNPHLPVFRDLATSRRIHGDLSAAISILRHGLETSRNSLASDDPLVLELAGHLGAYLYEQGAGNEAEEVLSAALAAASEEPADPASAKTIAVIADLLRQIQKLERLTPHGNSRSTVAPVDGKSSNHH